MTGPDISHAGGAPSSRADSERFRSAPRILCSFSRHAPDASNRLRPAFVAGIIGSGTRGREPHVRHEAAEFITLLPALLPPRRQFYILQAGPGWQATNAIRSIETTRVYHASRHQRLDPGRIR